MTPERAQSVGCLADVGRSFPVYPVFCSEWLFQSGPSQLVGLVLSETKQHDGGNAFLFFFASL